MLNSLPKHSGIYFIKDNINNLQFTLKFRCINTLLKLPKYEVPGNLRQDFVANQNSKKYSSEDETNIITIKWQQKLFSPTECDLYIDLKNCTNDQQKKYYQMLMEENETNDKKQTKKKRNRKLRTKSKMINQNEDSEGSFIFTYVQEDNFKPPEDLGMSKSKLRRFDEPFETMYVYAALNPDTQLVILKWFNSERLLYIYPDFTDFQLHPYFIEIDSDYRHLYSYGIEDISLKELTTKPKQEHFLHLPEMPTHWRIEDEQSQKFEMPPKRSERCAILFSVNDLSSFEYDNVHVRYHIKLPGNTILEEGLLDATSHTASSSDSIIHIGLTWQITVLCEEQFDPSQNLRIFFEIISIDSWQRERFEGFCYYSLGLLKPCQHLAIQLQCIRPVDSLIESINRFFIGGRRKFDYVRFVCEHIKMKEDDDSSSNVHCRYGVRMQNSGQLSLNCQVLTQRNCELLNPCLSRTSGMTLDDIMMAYKEARRRLEAVTFK